MSAHPPKPTLTPERIEQFAAYLRSNPAWGVFHVVLDDGNWRCPISPLLDPGTSPDVVEMAAWLDSLTLSQQQRLRKRAESKPMMLGKR